MFGSKIEICELPPSPFTSDPLYDVDTPSRNKKKGRLLRDKKSSNKSSFSTSSFHDDMWSVTPSCKSMKEDDLSSSSSVRKQKKGRVPRLKVL